LQPSPQTGTLLFTRRGAMSTEKIVGMVVIGVLFFLFALVNAKSRKDVLLGACMALGLMAFILFMHSPAWEYIEVTVFKLPLQ
jgi:hypothetical protein